MRRNQRAAHGRRSRRGELERLEPRWAFNVAPTGITLDPASVPENSGLLAPVGTLHVSDPDAGDTHRFILLDSAGGRFTLDGDQVVVAAGPQLDFETGPSHSITVRAIDAGGLSIDVSLPIAVTDVSEPPTDIQLDIAQVPENSPAHFVIGKFATTDQDVGDTFAYSLIDSAGGRFEISGDLLAVAPNADLDYEAAKSQVIRVRTTDGSGLFFERDLTIDITNVNERPGQLKLSNVTLPENSPAGTVVGELTATDVDFAAAGLALLFAPDGTAQLANLGPDTITFDAYQIESQAGKLDPVGWRSIADWSASGPQGHADALAVLGPGGDSAASGWLEAGLYPNFLGEFNVAGAAVLSPNEVVPLGKPLLSNSPADFQLTYHAVGPSEGIFTAAVVDQTPLKFSLVDSAGGRFEIAGNQLRTAPGFNWDFEANPRYPVRVRVTDGGGLTFERTFVVQLANVNEAPQVIVPGQLAAATGEAGPLPGIRVSDPDVVGDVGQQAEFRLALAVDQGKLSFGSLDGLQIADGANNSSAVTVVGPLAKLNVALTTLNYEAPGEFAGQTKLSLTADDQGFLGSGTPLSTALVAPIVVNHRPAGVADHYDVAAGGELRRQGYAQAVLADGPLAYWRLGEAPEAAHFVDTAGNYSGGGFQGNVQLGKPSALPHDDDASVSFDGQSGASVPFGGQAKSLQQSFTIEAWIRPSQTNSVQGIITTRDNVFGSGWAFGSDGPQLMFTTFDYKNYRLPNYSIPTNQWTHVAAVFDSGFDATFFVNGELKGKVDGDIQPGVSADTVWIGRNPINSIEFWHGGLDEIALYARELTPGEIARHYQSSQADFTVLANDTDADGDALTATLAEGPQHGQLTFAADGSFVYKPNAGFVGQDAFSYRASDGFFASGPTLVTINVTVAAGAALLGGDFDGDGDVDLDDFGLLKANFGSGTSLAQGDADGNGRVDLNDFGLLKNSFGANGEVDNDVLLALAMDQATRRPASA